MFADDMAFYCHENSPTDLQLKLNADLGAITSWLHDNKLALNAAKSKFMIIGSRTKLSQFNYIALDANNDRLENVTEFKYLGVTINQYLTWHDHIDQLPFSRLPVLFCITMYLNVDVRQFRAILQFLPEIASHSRSNTL